VPGLTAALRRHRSVGLDTSIFIYHIEAAARFSPAAKVALDELALGTYRGVMSILTLMELAVRPMQLGQPAVADEYEVLLTNFPNLRVVDVDRVTMRQAANLRATYRLRPVDALQVAACLQHGATAFLTNDRGLRRVSELEVLLLQDFLDS